MLACPKVVHESAFEKARLPTQSELALHQTLYLKEKMQALLDATRVRVVDPVSYQSRLLTLAELELRQTLGFEDSIAPSLQDAQRHTGKPHTLGFDSKRGASPNNPERAHTPTTPRSKPIDRVKLA